MSGELQTEMLPQMQETHGIALLQKLSCWMGMLAASFPLLLEKCVKM